MENLVGEYVLLKFYYGHKDSVNPVLSKTMGRIAIINFAYLGNQPQPGSFWLCKIDQQREDPFNPEHGCFIVSPVHEVAVSEIVKLVPNTYTTEITGSTVVLRPKIADQYWICPFSIKKFYIKKDETSPAKCYQSVVVPLRLNNIPKG